MLFQDLVTDADQWKSYEGLLADFSMFVSDCVRLLIDAYRASEAQMVKVNKLYLGTVTLLTRHLIEAIDGVSILATKGSAENCGPLLRSAFEAQLEIDYVLEADSERRGLAYQVGYAHRRIKLYRKCNPKDQDGKQLRQKLKDDPLADVFDNIPHDLAAAVKNLEGMFAQPDFVPIEQEWQRLKKQRNGKDPDWYMLFNGPASIERLAYKMKQGAVYEGLYRQWSDIVHAGGIFSNAALAADGSQVIRPIRHPDGIETVCSVAAGICLHASRALLSSFSPGDMSRFQQAYTSGIQPRYLKLMKGKLIDAPWK